MCFGNQLLIWDASEAEQPKEKRKPPTCAALQAKKTCTRQRQHKQRTQPPPSPPGNTCNPLTVMLPHYVMIKKKKTENKSCKNFQTAFCTAGYKDITHTQRWLLFLNAIAHFSMNFWWNHREANGKWIESHCVDCRRIRLEIEVIQKDF